MQVPKKIKNFIWRACRNSLPTKENLVRRTIIENPLCDRCSCANESTMHTLRLCGELDVVWEDLSLWSCRNTFNFITFKELLSWLIKHQHHVELFLVTAWSVWTQWNQVRLNKPSCSLHLISFLAKERLQEFLALNPHPPLHRTAPPLAQKWKPPQHRLVKINCEGARFTAENRAGIGVVIGDSEGMVLGSLSKQISQAYSPLEIEAMVVTTAMQFVLDLGFQHAILGTNLLVLVKALREDTKFLLAVGLVLDEIRIMVNLFNELH